MTMSMPHVPVSWGELLDKITILEIKVARIADAASRANAAKELALLAEFAGPVTQDAETAALVEQLRSLNTALWEIEDRIRECEAAGKFDAEFVALARSVYKTNDERGRIKRQINLRLGSDLVEEKSYARY